MSEKEILLKKIAGIVIKMVIGACIGVPVAAFMEYNTTAMVILFSGFIEGWKVISRFMGTFIAGGVYGIFLSLFLLFIKVFLACLIGFFVTLWSLTEKLFLLYRLTKAA